MASRGGGPERSGGVSKAFLESTIIKTAFFWGEYAGIAYKDVLFLRFLQASPDAVLPGDATAFPVGSIEAFSRQFGGISRSVNIHQDGIIQQSLLIFSD